MTATDASPFSALLVEACAPMTTWPSRYPDHSAMGYLCSYVPEELVHAAGFTPLRVRASPAALRQVDAHLQSFACALCRSTLDQLLTGELDFLAGALFAHTCDAMQAQADLWRMSATGERLVGTLMHPAHLGSRGAGDYLVAELARFRARLAAFAGRPIDDDALRASITLYDETRDLVAGLVRVRDRLDAASFFAVLDAAQAMPREVFNPLLAGLLPSLEAAAPRPPGMPLFLTGAVLDEPRLLALIDELGAQVAGDDLCSGSRHFQDRVGTNGTPLQNLAAYSLRRPLCPTKYRAGHDPGGHLLDLVRESGAKGVVFVVEKFCEPHAFEHALARPALDRAGIPYLFLEMEQTPSLEALRTRLEAFLEML